MRIPIHESLKVARSVINKINLPTKIAKECQIESWSNCREQGLCIKRYPIGGDTKSVVISQARNSDEILVVCGKRFDIQTNQPSDESWNNGRRYFRYNKQKEAAKHIVNFLKN